MIASSSFSVYDTTNLSVEMASSSFSTLDVTVLPSIGEYEDELSSSFLSVNYNSFQSPVNKRRAREVKINAVKQRLQQRRRSAALLRQHHQLQQQQRLHV